MNISRLTFLSDFNCKHSEIKSFAKLKLIVRRAVIACVASGTVHDSSSVGRGFEALPRRNFLYHKGFSSIYLLNSLSGQSFVTNRQTIVGLFYFSSFVFIFRDSNDDQLNYCRPTSCVVAITRDHGIRNVSDRVDDD